MPDEPVHSRGKGKLIGILLFLIVTLPLAVYFGMQQYSQITEQRGRAAGEQCTAANTTTGICADAACYQAEYQTEADCLAVTDPTSGTHCCKWSPWSPTGVPPSTTCPVNILACKPGGANYFSWLPNHVICGTCTNGTEVCGTWEGEAGITKSVCCGNNCAVEGSAYPWTFEDTCLSSQTSNQEGCYNSPTDCARVTPCETETNPPEPTNTPIPTVSPTPTRTPTPTLPPQGTVMNVCITNTQQCTQTTKTYTSIAECEADSQ
jgi:hypothetical protein